MNTHTLYFFAFIGGMSLAIQSGFNAQLGVMLKNPFLASFIAYSMSTVFALSYLLIENKPLPTKELAITVPTYLWVVGGLFSMIGVSLYYYIIPKIGIAKMFTFGLSGQMVFVLIAGYFGWFNLPTDALSIQKLIGVVLLLLGVALITKG